VQPVCKLPRQGRISGYKHDEHDGLDSVQGEQGEHSTTSTTGCIGVHCRASLLYSRIISPMEMIVFNDNLYLAYCYLPVNPNVPGNPLISQALTPRPYIRGISDWDVTLCY